MFAVSGLCAYVDEYNTAKCLYCAVDFGYCSPNEVRQAKLSRIDPAQQKKFSCRVTRLREKLSNFVPRTLSNILSAIHTRQAICFSVGMSAHVE